MTPQDNIPYGFCHCGCGRKTTISKRNSKMYGYVKGEPKKVCQGHGGKVARPEPTFGVIEGEKVAYIGLTLGKITIVDLDEYPKLIQVLWQAHCEKRTGTFYAVGEIDGERTSMHRFLLGLKKGEPLIGEHKNGNSLDNRRSNLRRATQQKNTFNRKLNKNSSSGFKGVKRDARRNKWHARIQAGMKRRSLGYFDTPQEAYAAYCEAAKRYHGEFARFA